MRKLSQYECYLHEQRRFFFYFEDNDNEIPYWLIFEENAYYWMASLTKKLKWVLINGGTFSIRLQEKMKNAVRHRVHRYRSISPELKEAVRAFAEYVSSTYAKLLSEPDFWLNEYTLSKKGRSFFEQELKTIYQFEDVKPDRGWRIREEREKAFPYLCRYDAFEAARIAVEKEYSIRINIERDRSTSPYYSMHATCKNSVLTAVAEKCFPRMEHPNIRICTVIVDMKSGELSLYPVTDESASIYPHADGEIKS